MSDLFATLELIEGYEVRSPLLREGVSCDSCVFQRRRRCQMLEVEVERDGLCRFWLPDQAARWRRGLPVSVHACVQAWAEGVSELPLGVDGTSLKESLGERLVRLPAPGLSTQTLVSAIATDLGYHGNAYVGKYRDAQGEIRALGLIEPREVDELYWEAGEPRYWVGDRALTPRDVIHVALSGRGDGAGQAPIALIARGGADLGSVPAETVRQVYRVEADGRMSSDAADRIRGLIEAAFAQDSDLFPASDGLTPRFVRPAAPSAEAPATSTPLKTHEERSDELLAAILELSRREAPSVTLEPQIHLPEVHLHAEAGSKRLERDGSGRVVRVIEERARHLEYDEQGQITKITED